MLKVMTYLGKTVCSYKAPWTMDNLEKEVNVNMPGQLSLKKKRETSVGFLGQIKVIIMRWLGL